MVPPIVSGNQRINNYIRLIIFYFKIFNVHNISIGVALPSSYLVILCAVCVQMGYHSMEIMDLMDVYN